MAGVTFPVGAAHRGVLGVRPVVVLGAVGDNLPGGLRTEPVDLVGDPEEAVAQEHRGR
jgi:hypothetical protein